MAFQLNDYECQECKHIQEILVDKNKDDLDNPEQECNECGTSDWKRKLTAGTANHAHVSWAKWRV